MREVIVRFDFQGVPKQSFARLPMPDLCVSHHHQSGQRQYRYQSRDATPPTARWNEFADAPDNAQKQTDHRKIRVSIRSLLCPKLHNSNDRDQRSEIPAPADPTRWKPLSRSEQQHGQGQQQDQDTSGQNERSPFLRMQINHRQLCGPNHVSQIQAVGGHRIRRSNRGRVRKRS